MQDRLAFTAKQWGGSAVVCRALDGRSGPAVVQEFGPFITWTQANAFACRLNEGLELDHAEARQIVTGSSLLASDFLATAAPRERVSPLAFARVASRPLRVGLILAELNLAVAFCRLLHTEPKLHSPRILRNTHNAFFNALHFLLRSDLSARELEQITAAVSALHDALQGISPPVPASPLNATSSLPPPAHRSSEVLA